MRSQQLADIAGVSVRTLRHYHAMGLLDEPPRQANGYRDYSALDLARVLRIKRLASLGFSLMEIRDMLDAPHGGAPVREDEALAQLDDELCQQIERLQEQRRTIALLQQERLDPALPARFAQLVKRLYGDEADRLITSLDGSDEAALVIAGHLYRDEDLAELERFTETVEGLGLMETLHDLERKTRELPPDAAEDERAAIVDDAMRVLAPALDQLDPANWEDDGNDAVWELIDSLQSKTRNPAQIDIDRRMEEAILKYLRTRTA